LFPNKISEIFCDFLLLLEALGTDIRAAGQAENQINFGKSRDVQMGKKGVISWGKDDSDDDLGKTFYKLL